MRTFLLVACVALVFVVGVLFVFRHAIRRGLRGSRPPPVAAGPESPSVPPAGPLPDVARRARTLQHAPEVQQLLAEFVRDCASRGDAAVAELRARLRDEPDVEIAPRWDFEDGRVRGFPSLRSAYIAALLEIPGAEARDALLDVLAATPSASEAYQIAAGLDRRGEGGFTPAAFERAVKAGPGDWDVRVALVELLARADPEGTAAEVVARSPRGEDGTDPAVLGQVLENLPSDRAIATAHTLLADPQVTRKGKARYIQGLCDRGEPQIFSGLRDVANEGILDRELCVTMAYAACGSRAFYEDQAAYAAAGPGGDARVVAEIRERYLRRLDAAEALVDAVVPRDQESRALLDSLKNRLAEKRSTAPGGR